MGKIISVSKIKTFAKSLKSEGKTIVLAGGCFDILHIGHITFFQKAKKTGDILVLLLESDQAIKNLKGDKRPINKQENRAEILSAIETVDLIIPLPKPYKNEDYQKLVTEIAPNIIAVTSGDPNIENKKLQAKLVDGEVKIVLKQIPDHSTTKLLEYF